MTIKRYKPNWLFMFVLTELFSCNQIALAQQPPVVIKTYGQHFGGNIIYHHYITNNGNRDVVKIAIGLDTDETSPNVPATREQGELNFVMPIGSGVTNLRIDPASISGSVGWTAEIIQIEDGGRYTQWYSPTSSTRHSIRTNYALQRDCPCNRASLPYRTLLGRLRGWKKPLVLQRCDGKSGHNPPKTHPFIESKHPATE